MIRWWQRSLAAQFIGFMLLALISSQTLSFLISWDDRDKALKTAVKSEFFSRTASTARLMEVVPRDLRREILSAAETSYSRFWLSQDEPSDAAAFRKRAAYELTRPMAGAVDLPAEWGSSARTSHMPDAEVIANSGVGSEWIEAGGGLWPLQQAARFTYLGPEKGVGMGMSVRLNDGTWLQSAYYKVTGGQWWNSSALLSFAVAATILSVIGVLAATRIARPLRRLARAAEALGRGEAVPALPEEGPDDIRQTAISFNQMQERLRRFVDDRMRLLAAIGHDLRTPLTSLRLRVEFVSDPELQQKMLDTIDEIQAMTSATMAFARDETTAEKTRNVDLNALVESLCDDLRELGAPIECVEGEKTAFRCRPNALRRAIRNLVENAVRYGGTAKVYLKETDSNLEIVVEDKGPGIPANLMETVFSPFFRIEASRNRETGGVGLGMSIARAIARHHGGDILLSPNNPGLKASISLPKRRTELNRLPEGAAAHWTL